MGTAPLFRISGESVAHTGTFSVAHQSDDANSTGCASSDEPGMTCKDGMMRGKKGERVGSIHG